MIHIRLNSPSEVIKTINTIELPNFCLITGKNGSGKTKLLESLQSGNIIASNLHNGQRLSSTYFNYNDFTTKDPRVYGNNNQPRDLNSFIDNGDLSRFTNELNNILAAGSSVVGVDLERAYELLDFYSVNETDARVLKRADIKLDKIGKERFKRIRRAVFSIDDFRFYYSISGDIGINPRSLGGLRGDTGYLGKRIRDLFIDYSIKLTKFKHTQLGVSVNAYRSNIQKFIKDNGRAPWDELNEVLKNYPANNYLFDVELYNKPAEFGVRVEDFVLPIQVRDGEHIVPVDQLSSGEKTLLALAVVIYEQGKVRQGNILLLDEIDSSLHPSMTKQLLQGLESSFVNKGYRIIFVTHSPSTVAFASEESLFELRNSNEKGHELRKISRDEGLKILTSGFMTLDEGLVAIKSNKLLVFTEGPTDIQYITYAANILGKNKTLNSVDIRIVGDQTSNGTVNSSEKELRQLAITLSHHEDILNGNVLFIHDPETQTYQINNSSSMVHRLFLKKNPSNNISNGIEALLESSTVQKLMEAFPESFKIEKVGTTIEKIHILRGKKEIANFCSDKAETYRHFIQIFDKIDELL